MFEKEKGLFDAFVAKKISRREVINGAGKLGLTASAAGMLCCACSSAAAGAPAGMVPGSSWRHSAVGVSWPGRLSASHERWPSADAKPALPPSITTETRQAGGSSLSL